MTTDKNIFDNYYLTSVDYRWIKNILKRYFNTILNTIKYVEVFHILL